MPQANCMVIRAGHKSLRAGSPGCEAHAGQVTLQWLRSALAAHCGEQAHVDVFRGGHQRGGVRRPGHKAGEALDGIDDLLQLCVEIAVDQIPDADGGIGAAGGQTIAIQWREGEANHCCLVSRQEHRLALLVLVRGLRVVFGPSLLRRIWLWEQLVRVAQVVLRHCVVDADVLLIAADQEPRAVATEARAMDGDANLPMLLRCLCDGFRHQLFPGVDVPQLDQAILAAGRHHLAVPAEGDDLHRAFVGPQLLGRLRHRDLLPVLVVLGLRRLLFPVVLRHVLQHPDLLLGAEVDDLDGPVFIVHRQGNLIL
mmetsp:Transcript_75508/g.180375  ORF Transcript_75508/g.180375 Transcript_75508/m.180375 type:complete len:311 (-) Transcript_75508:4113-5045(-)